MSAWKICVRELYARGGSIRASDLFECSGVDPSYALKQAKKYGLVDGTTPGIGRGARMWSLTESGAAFAENRLTILRRPPVRMGRPSRRMMWLATWIAVLPSAADRSTKQAEADEQQSGPSQHWKNATPLYRAAGQVIPEPPTGWKLVPIEPTPEMLDTGAMENAMNCQRMQTAEMAANEIYRAMLKAAPTLGDQG